MRETKSIGIYLTSMTIGGAERVALDLSIGLFDQGYDVDLVLVDASGDLLDEVPDNVSIVDLEAKRVATSLLPLRRYLISREPDVLYSMMTEPNLIAIAAHQLASTNTRLVISEHNMLSHSIDSLKNRFITLGAWASYPLADHAVAVSKGVRNDLLDKTRLEDDSISMIYNPVRVESIREQASEPVGHEWLADESLEVVLSGGRHEPQKGFDTLLDAFARLKRDNVRLVLFGKGPETEALQRQAIELGISDRVSFPGFVDNPYSYMSAADVFVLSSVHEGFGLVLIEAMACGCPVVSTDCESGPDEILMGGECGLLVPVGDDDMLAKAIIQSLDNPIDTEILQQRADDFSVNKSLSKYTSIFYRDE